MTDLPEVAWLYAFPQDKPITRTWADWKEYKNSVEFLRADTAIPRAEADAMVGAAYQDVLSHLRPINGKSSEYPAHFVRWLLTQQPADARAAFEQAVREAVEAERARCAQIADNALWDDPMDETESVRNRTLRSVAAAIRAPQEPSE